MEAMSSRKRFEKNNVTEEWLVVTRLEPGTEHIVRVTSKNGEHVGATSEENFITSKLTMWKTFLISCSHRMQIGPGGCKKIETLIFA